MTFYIWDYKAFVWGTAYAEIIRPTPDLEPESCPKCDAPRTGYLPGEPTVIRLNSKKVKDFIYGSFGNLFACERFVKKFKQKKFKGVKRFEKAHIKNKEKLGLKDLEDYYYVDIGISQKTVLDEKKSKIKWAKLKCDYCRSGYWSSYKGLYIKEDSWAGEDLFYAWGRPGIIFVSERLAEMIKEEGFNNVELVSSGEYFSRTLINDWAKSI